MSSPEHVGDWVRPNQVRAFLNADVQTKNEVLVMSLDGEDETVVGFDRKKAASTTGDFVNILNSLSEKVAEQFQVSLKKTREKEALDQALYLQPDVSESYLRKMRDLGAGLYGDLNKQTRSQFCKMGFPLKMSGDHNEPEACYASDWPAFTFREDVQNEGHMPIIWDILYEGTPIGKPHWEQFWGFRVPISYWYKISRINEINPRNGLFTAVHETLNFAGDETQTLVDFMDKDADSLASLFESKLRQTLRDFGDPTTDETAPLEGKWLKKHTDIWLAQKKMTEVQLNDWCNKVWVDWLTLKRGKYGLVHFACHGTSSKGSEYLSTLNLRVAGIEIPLTVSLMSGYSIDPGLNRTVPGPLVFLNACSTGKKTEDHRPPGFPLKWVRGQRALAVLVTLCAVPDYFAYRFAERFYKTLFNALKDKSDPDIPLKPSHEYLAEALLATRRYFMRQYNNPLGLAYMLYAVSGAHLETDFLYLGDPT